ncbi:A disintegrin and metalloproteinase with thrombospondin motifs 19 [Amyelois transitella]|uniref:A disintegrin and metalloproteinase with thrombospondin motifs 19 n=1 Tax=Amyelois transitella TaxID=680683 RepID=UPI00067CECD0|nr:A disintegrin and metalloproteinase with thrombospondin motifs 19 [Amyelois transitella]
MIALCSVLLSFMIFYEGFCKQRFAANHANDNSVRYFEKYPNITIPIMIHFDKALTLRMRKSQPHKMKINVKILSKNLLKKVENIFRRPFLNQRVKFKLLEARNLKRRIVNDTNVSIYLKRYCKWQGERKRLRKKSYFSVLLTGLDVYYLNKGRKVWTSTGRSYKGGVCSAYHSCTLLEWKGRNVDFLLAHEIAHSLGVRHDSQPRCSKNKYIMGQKYDPLRNPDTWSICSRRDLQEFLMSKESLCLRRDFKV